jgi:hypothetical protein
MSEVIEYHDASVVLFDVTVGVIEIFRGSSSNQETAW